MASGVYQQFIVASMKGQVNVNTDVFKVMLVTSGYTPNFDTHDHVDDVTNEVVGTGYTAGGDVTTVTVTDNAANDRVDYNFDDVEWPTSTITARGAVIYVEKGTSSQDLLVAYVDFGADRSTVAGLFTFTATSPLRYQR